MQDPYLEESFTIIHTVKLHYYEQLGQNKFVCYNRFRYNGVELCRKRLYET